MIKNKNEILELEATKKEEIWIEPGKRAVRLKKNRLRENKEIVL